MLYIGVATPAEDLALHFNYPHQDEVSGYVYSLELNSGTGSDFLDCYSENGYMYL